MSPRPTRPREPGQHRSFDKHWPRERSESLEEFFERIEKRWNDWPKRGITAEELSETTGLSLSSCKTKLSRFTNFWDEERQCFRHYLVRVKFSDDIGMSSGHYIPGPDWWGEMIYRNKADDWTETSKETDVYEWLNKLGCVNGKFDRVRG